MQPLDFKPHPHDAKLIEYLAESEVDMNLNRTIDYTFLCPSMEIAEALAERLKALGHEIEEIADESEDLEEEDDDDAEDLDDLQEEDDDNEDDFDDDEEADEKPFVVSTVLQISVKDHTERTQALLDLVYELGVEWDGWGCSHAPGE